MVFSARVVLVHVVKIVQPCAGLKISTNSTSISGHIDIKLPPSCRLESLEDEHFQNLLNLGSDDICDTKENHSPARLEDFPKMAPVLIQQWDYLDCGFMCVTTQAIQTYLEQQHSYEAAMSLDSHPNILVSVIASHLHPEACVWQTDAENRPDRDCLCITWEYSISNVRLPEGRATLEEYLKMQHGIKTGEALSRIWEHTNEETVRKLAELVPYPSPASSPERV